jgi:outer membrane protein OmpA-like peptidoglycan-associated protein
MQSQVVFMKNIPLIFIFLVSAFGGYGQSKDTFEVYFPLNVSKISKENEAYIDRLVFKDSLLHGDKLIVLGYTDYVGGTGYNDTLSMRRAKNVRNYLISEGLDQNDIKLCMGKGKIDRTNRSGKDGYAPDRKVQIIIDRAVRTPQPEEHPGGLDIHYLKVDQTIALNNIFFKLNSPVLLDKSQPDLTLLLNFMKQNPNVTIRIEGHVCCMGPVEGVDSKNKDGYLSEERAQAIYQYLADKGIDKQRMTFKGLGNRNPIVKTEVTESDRAKNRRVEIRIMSK